MGGGCCHGLAGSFRGTVRGDRERPANLPSIEQGSETISGAFHAPSLDVERGGCEPSTRCKPALCLAASLHSTTGSCCMREISNCRTGDVRLAEELMPNEGTSSATCCRRSLLELCLNLCSWRRTISSMPLAKYLCFASSRVSSLVSASITSIRLRPSWQRRSLSDRAASADSSAALAA